MERTKQELDAERRRLLAKFDEWGLPPPPNTDLHPDVLRHILFYAKCVQRRDRERAMVCQAAVATRH
jgi:hypothetical protein